MIKQENYKFEPGAMSIIQMGEELIGHPSTAINELVKNSYDADADKCWVYTQYDVEPKLNFLIIKDNGLGMDSSTLFGNWLKPSISSKRDIDREKRKSEIYERRFLGSKGIGRLASMALGRYLTVITKKAYENEYNWLRIDRESFRVENLLFEITFPGGTILNFLDLFKDNQLLEHHHLDRNENLIQILSENPFGMFKEGTMIVLENLDDSVKAIIEEEFNHKEIDETAIFKSLRDLITPLRLNSSIQNELVANKILGKELNIDNGSGTFELFYGINFIQKANEQGAEFLPIEPSKIIDFYDYRVFGKVTQEYRVEGMYICRRLEEDKREDIFDLPTSFVLSDQDYQVRKTIEKEDIPIKYRNADVGEFYFDIRVYDLDVDVKDKMVTLLQASGRREASQILNKYLGLKISKNGFGVKPYGEEEQDWLGLGAKRVNQHIITIGPNQILGYAFLYSPQNDSLSEKTNREGFFENKAFLTFKKILNAILEETGRRRAKYRESHNLGRKVKSKLERPDSEKFIKYILQNTNNPEIERVSRQFIEETNSALDNMLDSLTFSQRLASLGTGLELVYHELSQPLNAIGTSLDSLLIYANKVQDENQKEKILDRANNIMLSLKMLETLKDSLQPAIGKSMPRTFKPADTFTRVCKLFENIMVSEQISLMVEGTATTIEIKSVEYIFWISFLNIINNAMYWLRYSNQKKSLIFRYDDVNGFEVSNSGPLIPEEELDVIFGYGITGKKEKNATGLGLAYTRSMLSTIGWDIWAENRSYGPAFYIKKESITLT